MCCQAPIKSDTEKRRTGRNWCCYACEWCENGRNQGTKIEDRAVRASNEKEQTAKVATITIPTLSRWDDDDNGDDDEEDDDDDDDDLMTDHRIITSCIELTS